MMQAKHQYFNGIMFTRDDKTGYYLNSTIRQRMHRYVWEFYNGKITDGYCVHHIDHDKSNNDITNLALMEIGEHTKMHGVERDALSHEEMCMNLSKNARPKASEWHRSEEGRKWHSEHINGQIRRGEEKEIVCQKCGIKFQRALLSHSKFCSNACRAAWRRNSGVDNEKRVCAVCGKLFTVNKYAKTVTCSRSCGSAYAYAQRTAM